VNDDRGDFTSRAAERPRRRTVPLVLASTAVAALVRLAPWRQVFTPDGVRILFDSDPHFHLFQAARLLANGFAPTWFDPALSWPTGASVLWPPLWDLAIAASTRLSYGPLPTMAQLEHVAAVLPVAVGCATVPVVAFVAGRLVGRSAAPLAATAFALLGSNIVITVVGRPDQHGLEILLHGLVMACFVVAVAARGAPWVLASVAGAAALALAFWNWQGSALDLVIPAVAAALGHLVLGREERVQVSRAAAGIAGVASLLVAASVVAWGPPGALSRGSLNGITGLHVALILGATMFAVVLLVAGKIAPGARLARRAAEVLVAVLAAVAVSVGWSADLREGVRHGLTALGAASPWHETISEFRPLMFSCEGRLADDLRGVLDTWGLVLAAGILAVPSLVRRWRAGGPRAPVLVLAAWGGIFLVLALLRRRFGAYLAIPACLLAVEGLFALTGWVGARSGRWRPLLVPAGVLALVLPCVRGLAGPMPQSPAESIDAARWMRTQPVRVGYEGVLAPWDMGHLILYYARRPVVVSPFGTDLGPEPMRFASTFRLALDPAEAEEMLLRRRVGYLVLSNPAFEVLLDQQLAPAGTPVYAEYTCRWGEAPTSLLHPEFDSVVGSRLFYFDGLSFPRPAPPFTRLRQVYETPGLAGHEPAPASVKVYEVVRGARVTVVGATPGAELRVEAAVRTSAGRLFTWSAASLAPLDGTVRLRVPYASGVNGSSSAIVTLSHAGRIVPLQVEEGDVLEGRETRVAIDGTR
jgi:asparagine N-glycosylation enzyme membrane subunit Stt3